MKSKAPYPLANEPWRVNACSALDMAMRGRVGEVYVTKGVRLKLAGARRILAQVDFARVDPADWSWLLSLAHDRGWAVAE